MTNLNKNILGFAIVAAVIMFAFASKNKNQPVPIDDPSLLRQMIVRDEMADVRSREDIKRQQELIVEEAYQLDLKRQSETNKATAIASAEKAKAEAIAKYNAEKAAVTEKYDTEITGIETKLDGIRKEKLSLTQALSQYGSPTQSDKLNPTEDKTVAGEQVGS